MVVDREWLCWRLTHYLETHTNLVGCSWPQVEIGLVVVGQATNILVFGFSVAVAALFLRFVKHVPEIL